MIKRWRWALGLVGLAALLAAGLFGWRAWEADWARRHPEAARIARYEKIFDRAWKTVDEKYYDPKFDHARWRKIRDVYRPRIKDQTFEAGFYINVLQNLMLAVGTSHVGVSMPPARLAAIPVKPLAKAGRPGSNACPDASRGIGFGFDFTTVRRGEESRMIVADVRRGPAERLGVTPGDRIQNFTMTAPQGRCPHLTLGLVDGSGKAREVDYDLEPDAPRSSRARADLPSGVRVLRFDQFDRLSADWLAGNLAGASAKGVILDLRGNGGGLVSVESRIASYFLAPGQSLGQSVQRGRTKGRVARRSATTYAGPLIVLIGPQSASAAEITAYLLRFHRRARLVGAETQGAVLTSRDFRLPDGGSVSVAVADYLTPDGRRLEGVGVKPDLSIAQTLEAIRAGRDLPLEAAERALLEGRWRP